MAKTLHARFFKHSRDIIKWANTAPQVTYLAPGDVDVGMSHWKGGAFHAFVWWDNTNGTLGQGSAMPANSDTLVEGL